MRDISFRAKSLDGIWFKWNLIDPINMAELAIDPKTVGQSTGLKDKNGVLIYQGDIVEWSINALQKDRMAVVWKEQGWLPFINYTSEIIGNIYNNPELLK